MPGTRGRYCVRPSTGRPAGMPLALKCGAHAWCMQNMVLKCLPNPSPLQCCVTRHMPSPLKSLPRDVHAACAFHERGVCSPPSISFAPLSHAGHLTAQLLLLLIALCCALAAAGCDCVTALSQEYVRHCNIAASAQSLTCPKCSVSACCSLL